MATWTEPTIGINVNLFNSVYLIQSTAQRSDYAAPAVNWVGESITNDISLDEDSPILVALQLKAKWGL